MAFQHELNPEYFRHVHVKSSFDYSRASRLLTVQTIEIQAMNPTGML